MTKLLTISRDMTVLVDDENFELASRYSWQSSQSGDKWYAQCRLRENGRRRTVALHRLLLNAPQGSHVEHIDGNGLNNQLANLKLKSGNGGEKKYRGVYRSPKRYRCEWRAYVVVGGRQRHIGYFLTEQGAALAYNKSATRYLGDKAKLNSLHQSEDEIEAAEADRFKWQPQVDQSSYYRGVNFMNTRATSPSPWRARIRSKERMVHIGSFATEEAAALAYNEMAQQLHGNRAILNVVPHEQRAAG